MSPEVDTSEATVIVPRPCPFCSERHDSGLVLCRDCERIAVAGRERRGVPVRPTLRSRDEPDD